MSKFARFGPAAGADHRGYAAGPTVIDSCRYDALLPQFKAWFASVDGFGEYLQSFFRRYRAYFDDYRDDHALVYTQLHKEFSEHLEQSVDGWLSREGLTEEDFGNMLQIAGARGDEGSDYVVGVLLGMLDYEQWIGSILALWRSSHPVGPAGQLREASSEPLCFQPPSRVEAPAQELHTVADGHAASP